MKRLLIFCMTGFVAMALQAQTQGATTGVSNEYRETPEKINDLVHTKLDAHFDYSRSQLIGKVWLTLKPHFYATDSLRLDAKGMDIKTVALVNGTKSTPLKYNYDGLFLKIHLN